ncbi:hypothetical protein [Aestuariimicrobium ganziense]|uniref:hypothetical protein n=1 Tax=Aestuariimicrobium ganziense TaxID=2773677 RepID=UPI001945A61D|nr:hypothetical protein [Aestuariimicrobium ganziense]
MDLPMIMIMVTAALSLVALVATLVAHQRGRGPRAILQGIGWVLLPIGLWVIGLMELFGRGAVAGYRWLMSTPMDLQRWIGVSIVAVAVLLVVVGMLVKGRTKDEARAAREARRQPVGATPQGSTGRALPSSQDGRTDQKPVARPAAKPAKDGLSDEDAEIEAILKRRGIN